MTETELYKSLGELTKDKKRWEENIPHIASLLLSESSKIKSKALWLLGEMGLVFPNAIKDHVAAIASFCDSVEPLLRERDSDDRVRMEAPEMFRVFGKRRPDFVKPYLEILKDIAETDTNRVVRIHCLGAIKATSL